MRRATRRTRGSRAARPRSRSRVASARWSRKRPRCGASSIPTAERPKQVLAALAAQRRPRTASAVGRRGGIAHEAGAGAVEGRAVGPGRRRGVPADQRAVRAAVRQARRARRWSAMSPSPIRRPPEAHFAVALAAFIVGPDDEAAEAEAANEIDRALALKPGLGPRGDAEGRDPRAQIEVRAGRMARIVRREGTAVAGRQRRARPGLCRAEALRRRARAVAEAVGPRTGVARARIRRRRDRARR